MQILGVDPGIANAAFAVVAYAKQKYELRSSQLIKTPPSDGCGKRLDEIHDALCRTLDSHDVNAIAIEQVYHNRNISSSISTGKVIGLCELTAHHYDLPVLLLTPQQVKAASGYGGTTNKNEMLKIASRVFRTEIKSHHEADAALAALAGILKHRSSAQQR